MTITPAFGAATFEARVTGFPPDLGTQVGVRILWNDGSVKLARTTTGILEDPAHSGSYVVTLATPSEDGQYSVFWDWDPIQLRPSRTASEDLIVGDDASTDTSSSPDPDASEEFEPTLTDVGSLLRARTRDANGNETGTFTANTRPTDSQVEEIIDRAVQKVVERVGGDIPDQIVASARDVVALRAAMLVELSFFGDQINAGRSPYKELQAEYTAALADLMTARQRLADADPTLEDPTTATGLPSYDFPTVILGSVHGSEEPRDGQRPIW